MCFTTRKENARIMTASHDIPVLKVLKFIRDKNMLVTPVRRYTVKDGLEDVRRFSGCCLKSDKPIAIQEVAYYEHGHFTDKVLRDYIVEEAIHCYNLELMISKFKVKHTIDLNPLLVSAIMNKDNKNEKDYIFIGYIPKGAKYVTDGELCTCAASAVVIDECVDLKFTQLYDEENVACLLSTLVKNI